MSSYDNGTVHYETATNAVEVVYPVKNERGIIIGICIILAVGALLILGLGDATDTEALRQNVATPVPTLPTINNEVHSNTGSDTCIVFIGTCNTGNPVIIVGGEGHQVESSEVSVEIETNIKICVVTTRPTILFAAGPDGQTTGTVPVEAGVELTVVGEANVNSASWRVIYNDQEYTVAADAVAQC